MKVNPCPFWRLRNRGNLKRLSQLTKENWDARSGLEGAVERSAVRGPGEG